jgi:hypothetical protein
MCRAASFFEKLKISAAKILADDVKMEGEASSTGRSLDGTAYFL